MFSAQVPLEGTAFAACGTVLYTKFVFRPKKFSSKLRQALGPPSSATLAAAPGEGGSWCAPSDVSGPTVIPRLCLHHQLIIPIW